VLAWCRAPGRDGAWARASNAGLHPLRLRGLHKALDIVVDKVSAVGNKLDNNCPRLSERAARATSLGLVLTPWGRVGRGGRGAGATAARCHLLSHIRGRAHFAKGSFRGAHPPQRAGRRLPRGAPRNPRNPSVRPGRGPAGKWWSVIDYLYQVWSWLQMASFFIDTARAGGRPRPRPRPRPRALQTSCCPARARAERRARPCLAHMRPGGKVSRASRHPPHSPHAPLTPS
jgi:hypothetical protein